MHDDEHSPVTVLTGTDAEDTDARAVNELLRDVRGYRAGWNADLSLAAAAAEATIPAVAVALLRRQQQQLAALEARLLHGLEALTRSREAAAADVPVHWQPPDGRRSRVSSAPPPPGRRHSPRQLPATIAAVAAAVAVVGGAAVTWLPDDREPAAVGAPGVAGATSASLAMVELQRVVGNGLSPEHVRVAAEGLNRSVAGLVERAGTDEAAGDLAMELLLRENALLQGQDATRLEAVLVEWQRLVKALASALPSTTA